MPCKRPALALQILLCISAMTAEELFLVALAFVVTLKRNGLLASSLFFLFAITFFFLFLLPGAGLEPHRLVAAG